MMKRLFTLILLSLPILSFGQTTSANQLIEEVRSHYNSDYAFLADFAIEVDIPESETTILDGTLKIKGDQFKFETRELIVISDNINMWYWTKTPTIDEVQISYVEDSEDLIKPSDVFSIYLKGFAYKLISETKFNGRNLALVELVPTQKNDMNPYFKIKATIDKDKSAIDQLQVFYKDGTVYTYKIKNERAQSFSSETFTFDSANHPSTEVIDLR